MRDIMWTFETANLAIEASIEPCEDLDLSWDEDGDTREGLESGRYEAFNVFVRVYHRATGTELGSDVLCENIYERPSDFFAMHRDPNPMNRNCSIMRAAHGKVTMCHYFPDMVSQALAEARKSLRALKSLPVRA